MNTILHYLAENEKLIIENFFIRNKINSNKDFKEFSNDISQKYDLENNNVELIWNLEANETARMIMFKNPKFKASKTKDKAFSFFSKNTYFLNKKNQSFLSYLKKNEISKFNLNSIDINYLTLIDNDGEAPIIKYIKEFNVLSKDEISEAIKDYELERNHGFRFSDYEKLLDLINLLLTSNIEQDIIRKNKNELEKKIENLIDTLCFICNENKENKVFSDFYINEINKKYIPTLTKNLTYLDLKTTLKNDNKIKKNKI